MVYSKTAWLQIGQKPKPNQWPRSEVARTWGLEQLANDQARISTYLPSDMHIESEGLDEVGQEV